MSEKYRPNDCPPELSEDEAYKLANEELHRMREERNLPSSDEESSS